MQICLGKLVGGKFIKFKIQIAQAGARKLSQFYNLRLISKFSSMQYICQSKNQLGKRVGANRPIEEQEHVLFGNSKVE